ncbi:MAG: tyrosinase family protein [Pseudonocardiaceae bacterium]
MAPTFELTVNGTADAAGRYLTWSPVPAALRLLDADGEAGPIQVTLGNGQGTGGKIVLRAERKDPPTDALSLSVAVDGTPREFFLAGRFGSPSILDRDAPLVISRADASGTVLDTVELMVRIRKDAETLSDAERGAFLFALVTLHGRGGAVDTYETFRQAHQESTLGEAHGNDGFLPWHRAYVLDLERALQRIDPAVSLPYWSFGSPSPRLFSMDFLGAPPIVGIQALFSPSNPLRLWAIGNVVGINRRPRFDPMATGAGDEATNQFVRADSVITGFGGTYHQLRSPFEQDPHGTAHTSFTGPIQTPATAPQDPLFFLLHANVDRLWAFWQWMQKRTLPTDSSAYQFQGKAGQANSTRIGHNRLDTMWPWNGVKDANGPRPPIAPRTPFPDALIAGPGHTPTVGAMIDYQGLHDATAELGFDYDDVPYQP